MSFLLYRYQNIIYNLKSAAYTVSGFLTADFLQSDQLVKGATVHQTFFIGATWLNSDAFRLHGSFLEREGGNAVSLWTDYASYQGKSSDKSMNTGSTIYPAALLSNQWQEMDFVEYWMADSTPSCSSDTQWELIHSVMEQNKLERTSLKHCRMLRNKLIRSHLALYF